MWFLAKRNKFWQRLVASAEGPFTTAVPSDDGKPTKCSDISSENSASFWIFGNLLANRNLNLTSRVTLLTVVSSLLTEARLCEFSKHLEYYLLYTLANSPISFWIDLTLPLPWPDISFGTLHLLLEPRFHPTPRFDLWVGQFVKSSISFGVSKMPARDKTRSTSFSGSENLQLRKWLEMSF